MGRHDRIFKSDPLILSSDLETEWTMAKNQKMVQGNENFYKKVPVSDQQPCSKRLLTF